MHPSNDHQATHPPSTNHQPTMALVPFLILSMLVLSTASTRPRENNLMFTDDFLPNEGRLTNGPSTFIMQNDCNLVLYGGQRGWQSNTSGRGKGCTVRLDNHGRFVIEDASGNKIFQSTPDRQTEQGDYVAMVQPDGEVAIYGPRRYSRGGVRLSTSLRPNFLQNNVLISGESLRQNDRLAARDSSLFITDDCRLVLQKSNRVIWAPNFVSGDHCFMRLNHRGQLNVIDDQSNAIFTLPESGEQFEQGEYALVLRSDAVFEVYGPLAWSTPNSRLNAANKL